MGARSFIEWCFENEKDIELAVVETKLKSCKQKVGGVPSNHAFVSDPTAITAIRNVQELKSVVVELRTRLNGRPETMVLRFPERWLSVVRQTKSFYAGKVQGDIISLKYTENFSVAEICKKLGIKRSSFFLFRSEILVVAEAIAFGLGLIKKRDSTAL